MTSIHHQNSKRSAIHHISLQLSPRLSVSWSVVLLWLQPSLGRYNLYCTQVERECACVCNNVKVGYALLFHLNSALSVYIPSYTHLATTVDLPKSPWPHSEAWTNCEGIPTELRVLENRLATWPDFPEIPYTSYQSIKHISFLSHVRSYCGITRCIAPSQSSALYPHSFF